MKTEPRKGKQLIPASLDNRSRSDNEKNNNNIYDITSLVNSVKKLTLKPSNMGLNEPGVVKIEHESNETERDNDSNIVTSALVSQLSNIKIAEEASIELDEEKRDICTVDNRPDVKEEKHGNDSEETGETAKDELCCRGPARPDFLSGQRSKSSPYQIHLSSHNRTDCGGVVYVGQSDIGPTEETVNIDQLQFEDNQQQSSPPFLEQGVSPEHNILSDDELLREIKDAAKDPKTWANMCTYLGGESEGYFETTSPLGVPGSSPIQHMITNSDQLFPERSPLLYSGPSSEQYLSQGSPQQVVPTLSNWQESIHTPSTSSPYSLSNPTSPSDVSSVDNPANAYLTEDFNDVMIGKPPNSLEDIDFSVPNHPVMNDYVDSFISSPQNTTVVTNDVNVPSPNGYRSNLSPQTTTSVTSDVNLLSPNRYTSNLSPQTTTTSISDEASLLSPYGYTSNLSPQSTTSVTSEVHLLSPSGHTSSVSPQVTTLVTNPIHTLSSNGYRRNISPQTATSVTNKNCMSSNTLCQNSQNSKLTFLPTQFLVSANGYPHKNNNLASTSPQATYGQSTVNILIPVLSRPQVQQQPLNRPRPRLILPARKETNVPSREEILKRLDRKKKKNAWLRVNLKSKEEVTRGDADGDTLLMIAVTREHDNLFELVYALVEYMRRHVPEALNFKNNFGQTALYNACIELPQHPLIARYLAETLLSLNVNIAEDKYGSGWSLVECVKRRGDSHSGVLDVLLNLKTAQGKTVFSL